LRTARETVVDNMVISPYQLGRIVRAIEVVADFVHNVFEHKLEIPAPGFAVGDPQMRKRLVVMESDGAVRLSGVDKSMLGDTKLELEVPAKYSYSVDLAKLGPESISYQPLRNVISVKLPDVEIDDPRPDVSKARTIKVEKGWCRWDEPNALKLRLLTSSLADGARSAASSNLPTARQVGKQAVADLVRQIHGPAHPGLVVVVE
ncbi:MAG TPA: DUF4230 domain-containing protein, partial [Planctomycetia bacterium]|nr:DUF4230 domain-containing protein [Planctomycetia bacterium]